MLDKGGDELGYKVIGILSLIYSGKIPSDIVKQKVSTINYCSWLKIKIYQAQIPSRFQHSNADRITDKRSYFRNSSMLFQRSI